MSRELPSHSEKEALHKWEENLQLGTDTEWEESFLVEGNLPVGSKVPSKMELDSEEGSY